MGLSRTSWAVSFAFACLTALRDFSVTLQPLSYPYPDGAMNMATNDFLASGCDEMVVIDTDVIFKPSHLAGLLEHDEPLVFGIYPKKEIGLTFPMEWLDEENPFAANPLLPGISPLVEVKRVARGFMRAKRGVFEHLAPHVPEYQDAETGRTYKEFWKSLPGGHSEDFAFCDLWRKHGGLVMVDQRAVAEHEGSVKYPIKGTY